jgi:hypothetical protein
VIDPLDIIPRFFDFMALETHWPLPKLLLWLLVRHGYPSRLGTEVSRQSDEGDRRSDLAFC